MLRMISLSASPGVGLIRGPIAGLVGAIFAGIAVAAPAGAADLTTLSGSWSGSGTVTLPSGNSEKVRCRAVFSENSSGARMSATCANASTSVQQTAELSRLSATRYSGDFFNSSYGISGSIRITISGKSLTASLNGGGGTAQLNFSR